MEELTLLLNPLFTNGFIISGIIIIFELIFGFVAKKIYRKVSNSLQKKKAAANDIAFLLINKIINIGINLAIFLIICQEVIPLKNIGTALLATGGTVALILTMFGKELAGNLIAGLQIGLFKPFEKGDAISIPSENIAGTIEDLNLRHVTIRTYENTILMIPNRIINEAIVENRRADEHNPDCIFYFCDIAYESDFAKAKTLLMDFITNCPDIIEKDKASAVIFGLGSSSVQIRLAFYIDNYAAGFKIKTCLNEYILREFPKNKIEIPYQKINVIN